MPILKYCFRLKDEIIYIPSFIDYTIYLVLNFLVHEHFENQVRAALEPWLFECSSEQRAS